MIILIKKMLCIIFFMILMSPVQSQDATRWVSLDDNSIKWLVKENDSHMDHVEMSGFYISAIVHYGIKNGSRQQRIHLVFPMLRTIPNNTHGSLAYAFELDQIPHITCNNVPVKEYPFVFSLRGILTCQSNTNTELTIEHYLFPSTDQPVFIDKAVVINTSKKPVEVVIPKIDKQIKTDSEKGVSGSYMISETGDKYGKFLLKSNESIEFSVIYKARLASMDDFYVSPDYEFKKRKKFVNDVFSNLIFESPDAILNRAFAFAKLRALESIYKTKGGLMHGPGGGRYYAAIWANDQAEYANPFFPFLGNLSGNESAINSFRHFARYMNDNYHPIPSSIIAEGIDYWNGAGDRGDMAMIAHGASRFALAYGSNKTARKLWPLIEWCLEYCRIKINKQGVVFSDSDELEGRFPAGDANLNTSSLYYDALISASYLGKEIDINHKQTNRYLKQAEEMKQAIENYFGSNINGYETYRYYNGNHVLRAWICTPLTVGIFERSKGTVDALFSKKLWTKDGLATQAGDSTFWDRSTLYGLRGAFAAGETKRTMDFFQYYSKRRLLGEHVPYAVEAYPEGNQRHLSAESALYCRVVTEGIFGIRPTGLNTFDLSPKMPAQWNSMALRNIKAFQSTFDIEITKENARQRVRILVDGKVIQENKMKEEETIRITL
jgi:hypothetical protein